MIDRETLHRAYAKVTLARQLDDKVHHASRSGGVWIPWFPWHGTELVASAVGLALRPDDYLVSYYRDAWCTLSSSCRASVAFAYARCKVSRSIISLLLIGSRNTHQLIYLHEIVFKIGPRVMLVKWPPPVAVGRRICQSRSSAPNVH